MRKTCSASAIFAKEKPFYRSFVEEDWLARTFARGVSGLKCHTGKDDRPDWDAFSKDLLQWYNAPLSEEKKRRIDDMTSNELACIVMGYRGSRAERNYACAKMLEEHYEVDISGWADSKTDKVKTKTTKRYVK